MCVCVCKGGVQWLGRVLRLTLSLGMFLEPMFEAGEGVKSGLIRGGLNCCVPDHRAMKRQAEGGTARYSYITASLHLPLHTR